MKSSIARESGISSFTVVSVAGFVMLNITVYFIRMLSVWHYGKLFCTSGGESLMIYSVWKRIHGLQVYEWPLKYPFSVTLYNYLFYDLYAGFLRLIGTWDSGILIWGRLLTSAFAVFGAIAQWKFVQHCLNLRGTRSLLSLFFAFGLWLSTSMVRWWALTLRPDVPAVALVMFALWIIIRKPRFGFAYAGAIFYLAWSFKQSVVLAFVATCLVLLFHKRWRDLSVMAAVFAALIAITFFVATPEYRFSILVAPRLVPGFLLKNALSGVKLTAIANAYWIFAPVGLLLAGAAIRANAGVRLLMAVFVVSLLGGLTAMARVGSSDNYLLEAFAAGTTLLQILVLTTPVRFAGPLVLYGCLQPAIQLATLPIGQRAFGTIQLATATEYTDAVALRERLEPMKKPIFTTDEIFALPWNSNGNRYPAFTTDPTFYTAARYLYQNGGIESMLQRGDLPTVILGSGESVFQRSLNPHYVKVSESFHQGEHYDIYVFRAPNP